MPYGRGIETACLLLFMMKSYNPMKAKVAGVFFFFLHSIIKCIRAAQQPAACWYLRMLWFVYDTKHATVRAERRDLQAICIYLFLSVRPAATTETFTIANRVCGASAMVMWILFFNCVAIVRQLQVRIELR